MVQHYEKTNPSLPTCQLQLNAAPIDPLDALNNVVELVVLVMLVVAVSELVTIPLLKKRIHKNHIESNKNGRHPRNKQPIHHFVPKKMANAPQKKEMCSSFNYQFAGDQNCWFQGG